MQAVKVGVIGCGAISDIYLTNMKRTFGGLSVEGISAKHFENAEKKAAKYQIKAYHVEDLLADSSFELLVILTPAPTHYELIKKALLAGKHVYAEKPLATNTQEAQELLALAEEKHLLLGCAPETFLGSALQTARAALKDGLLGKISSFHVVANRDITMLASILPFLRYPYGGIGYDYGPYYLTALISLLGPMKKVYASVTNLEKERINSFPDSPDYQKPFLYENESQFHALLTTKSGITGTFSLNGDSAFDDEAYFTIHGTNGILLLTDANGFGGDVRFIPHAFPKKEPLVLPPASPLHFNCRGIGPAEMARCIRDGGTPLVDAHMAMHVLEIIEKAVESSRLDLPCALSSTCEIVRPFTDAREFLAENHVEQNEPQ